MHLKRLQKGSFEWENPLETKVCMGKSSIIIVGMGVYVIALEDRRFVFVFNNQMIEGVTSFDPYPFGNQGYKKGLPRL